MISMTSPIDPAAEKSIKKHKKSLLTRFSVTQEKKRKSSHLRIFASSHLHIFFMSFLFFVLHFVSLISIRADRSPYPSPSALFCDHIRHTACACWDLPRAYELTAFRGAPGPFFFHISLNSPISFSLFAIRECSYHKHIEVSTIIHLCVCVGLCFVLCIPFLLLAAWGGALCIVG